MGRWWPSGPEGNVTRIPLTSVLKTDRKALWALLDG